MLNNQKENKEILGKEETGVDFVKETNADETSAASATVQSAQISGLNHVENAVVDKKVVVCKPVSLCGSTERLEEI